MPSQSRESRSEAFARDGFLLVKNLFPEVVLRAVKEHAENLVADPTLVDRNNLRSRYKVRPSDGVQVLDAMDPIADLMPSVRTLAADAAIVTILAEIYGDAPRLFKDKLIMKPPGSPGYPWHQDFIAWPFFPESFLTVMIALDDADEENGCLELIRGSHGRGYLSPRDGDFHDLPETAFAREDRVKAPLKAGDAAIFGAFTIHGSGANRSTRPRRQLYLSYNAENDGGDQRAAHYRYFHAWLRRRYEEYGAKEAFFR